MGLKKISGAVSNFREETRVTSAQTSNLGHTSFRTEKQVNFRVGNTPVKMKEVGDMELTDGDTATVVGTTSGGGLKAVLIRNDTTNIIYGYRTWYIMMWAIILLGIGVATFQMFIGFILAPLGLFMLYKGFQHVSAYKMMAA